MIPGNLSKNSLINMTLWSLFILFTLFVAVRGNPNVAQWYTQGAQHWLHGLDLYNTALTPTHGSHSVAGTGFIYLPQSAIMYIPFSLLPPCLSRIVWRITLIALLFIMTTRVQHSLKQHRQDSNPTLLSVIMLFLGISSTITGQMNIVLVAFTLFAAIAIANQHWRQAAFWLVFAFAAKPTAIVILLLGVGCYKPLRRPTCLYLAIMLLLPFAFQHPDYVIAQYKGMFHMLTAANNVGSTSDRWSQIFGMVAQISNITVQAHVQTAIRLVSALGTLFIMRNVAKHNNQEESAFFLFTLAGLYLMLFNPRTEPNDYVQLAPTIAILLACAPAKNSRILSALLLIPVCCMVFNGEISQLLIPSSHNWAAPLSTVCLCFYMAWLKLAPHKACTV